MRSLFTHDATHDAPTPTIQVAMTGGVFRHAAQVRQVFYNELRMLDPRAEINPQVVEPVEGALRLARKAAAKSAS